MKVPAPVRRQVEEMPQRPHEIDVPGILALGGLGEQQLGAPEAMHASVAPHEHLAKRSLLAVTVSA
jgi:hypothetical protein